MDSIQRHILQNHCLYQKSWVEEPKANTYANTPQKSRKTPRTSKSQIHGSNASLDILRKYDARIPTSRASMESFYNGPDLDDDTLKSRNNKRLNHLIRSEAPDSSSNALISSSVNFDRKSTRPQSLPTFFQDSEKDVLSSYQQLESRRQQRVNRRKPWTESSLAGSHTKDYDSAFFYDAYLPEDIEKNDLKKKSRKFVTNSKYGNVYELRNNKQKPKLRTPPLGTWLWEDDFNIWLYNKMTSSAPAPSVSQHDPKLSSNAKGSMSWRSDTDRTTTKTYKNYQSTPRRDRNGDKPHADLFAHYHSYRLEKQRRRDACLLIQKVFRGWRVRNRFSQLKRKAVLEHGTPWQKFVTEYKELIIRIQARYGELRGQCGIDLKEMEEFMDQKFKYERAFDDTAYGAKLMKQDLVTFFSECKLSPTNKELSSSFDSVFRGTGTTAEVVFVLDSSSSIGTCGFRFLTTFVKDVVSSFDIGPERVRVGVIPYNDAIYNSFGFTKHPSKRGIVSAIDELEARSGVTRTDLALKKMSHMMLSARPGVQRIGIVITDGRSSNPEHTRLAAQAAHNDNITVFSIGVGEGYDKDELEAIASSNENVFTVVDYNALKTIKEKLARKTCLAAGNDGTLRGKCQPLYKKDVMEMLWTIFPPPAARITRKSRWMHPIVDGQEANAHSILDEEELDATDIKTCLRVVIQAKLERQGFIYLPAKEKYSVEKVTNAEDAIKITEEWMKTEGAQEKLGKKKDNSFTKWLK
ncbi:uncharacterized protein LOC110464955 isoform X2 [Mizuhopecten yessoensis]|uniref:Collagen alpha-4(VI) chain n=1 Tax=Mizuhopecten yessoensis TaxID=6573 RepID=A0A210PSR0_MIZYE|nr:uncharacterized protein LOC110464955 isoform X2 [Mizuhopecten yessoensis]OWF39486.1 Collagen alpha-4(VI) chain [Mizuhopecten yessoensis]